MMSCPTCDHTMRLLGETVSWCPRCGTCYQTALRLTHVPKLVERCREFEADFVAPLDSGERLSNEWVHLGIAEAINVPERRT